MSRFPKVAGSGEAALAIARSAPGGTIVRVVAMAGRLGSIVLPVRVAVLTRVVSPAAAVGRTRMVTVAVARLATDPRGQVTMPLLPMGGVVQVTPGGAVAAWKATLAGS